MVIQAKALEAQREAMQTMHQAMRVQQEAARLKRGTLHAPCYQSLRATPT